MQVILLDKVVNLGDLGDQINVKPGYARNFLIPYGKAVLANQENVNFFEARSAAIKAKLANLLIAAKERAKKINELNTITIVAKAINEAKLFGSVNASAIAEAVTKAGVKVIKNEIYLPSGVLRTIGKHQVEFRLHREVKTNLIINVIPK